MIGKRKCLLWILAALFIGFEGYLFYLIHIAGVEVSLDLMYLYVFSPPIFSFLTFIIELATARDENDKISRIIFDVKGGNFIRIAMLFTLVADYFMVAKAEEDNLTGVIVFLGTQFFIFLHIFVNDESKKSRFANIAIRLILIPIFIIFAYVILGEYTDLMAIISVIYFSNLCVNAVFAHRIGRGGILLTVGLVLFALCDINVALSGLYNVYTDVFAESEFLYKIMNLNIDLIWLFYTPSQVLIPLTPLISNKTVKN